MDTYLDDRNAIERLKEDYNKNGNLVIGFDFDDTVFPYHDTKTDMVIDLLRQCKELGFTLCIWSTCERSTDIKYKVYISEKMGIKPDYVNESPLMSGTIKPYFNILLDDRAGLASSYNILKKTIEELGINTKVDEIVNKVDGKDLGNLPKYKNNNVPEPPPFPEFRTIIEGKEPPRPPKYKNNN